MKKLHPNQYKGIATLEDLPYDSAAPIKKDAKIKKIKGRPDDINDIGATGVTVGAFKNKGEWCYYVLWDKNQAAVGSSGAIMPMIVGIMGFKIEEIK